MAKEVCLKAGGEWVMARTAARSASAPEAGQRRFHRVSFASPRFHQPGAHGASLPIGPPVLDMSDLIVHGGAPLKGRIQPSANKNAVLPILAATLADAATRCALERVPEITDAKRLARVLPAPSAAACEADFASGVVEIEHRDTAFDAAARACRRRCARRSCWCRRCSRASASARIEDEVRGCTLGVREIDPHVEVFERFGARIERGDDGWVLSVKRPLQAAQPLARLRLGHHHRELRALCACWREAARRSINAACEPHVQEFCRFLIVAGRPHRRRRHVDAARSTGVESLGGGEHRFDEDFHEVTTFLALSAITGGDVEVKNPQPEHFRADRPHASPSSASYVTHEDGWSRAVARGRR